MVSCTYAGALSYLSLFTLTYASTLGTPGGVPADDKEETGSKGKGDEITPTELSSRDGALAGFNLADGVPKFSSPHSKDVLQYPSMKGIKAVDYMGDVYSAYLYFVRNPNKTPEKSRYHLEKALQNTCQGKIVYDEEDWKRYNPSKKLCLQMSLILSKILDETLYVKNDGEDDNQTTPDKNSDGSGKTKKEQKTGRYDLLYPDDINFNSLVKISGTSKYQDEVEAIMKKEGYDTKINNQDVLRTLYIELSISNPLLRWYFGLDNLQSTMISATVGGATGGCVALLVGAVKYAVDKRNLKKLRTRNETKADVQNRSKELINVEA